MISDSIFLVLFELIIEIRLLNDALNVLASAISNQDIFLNFGVAVAVSPTWEHLLIA
jgi:hypothetical protein